MLITIVNDRTKPFKLFILLLRQSKNVKQFLLMPLHCNFPNDYEKACAAFNEQIIKLLPIDKLLNFTLLFMLNFPN